MLSYENKLEVEYLNLLNGKARVRCMALRNSTCMLRKRSLGVSRLQYFEANCKLFFFYKTQAPGDSPENITGVSD